jgi:endonuclease YncB( thermonuclease family)
MLPDTAGTDVFVNAVMVGEGYAVVLEIDPNRAHRSELAALERDARATGAGLWGACGGPGVAVDAVTGR